MGMGVESGSIGSLNRRQIGNKEFSSIVLEKTRGHFKSAVHNGTHVRVIGRIIGYFRATIGASIGLARHHAKRRPIILTTI